MFDPRPDVDCYLQLAREKQVSITHIFETHIHADFVMRARTLCACESAKIFLSHEGRGDTASTTKRSWMETTSSSFVLVTVRHRPATRGTRCLSLAERPPGRPWGVLTGTHFRQFRGRPDLLGSGQDKNGRTKVPHTAQFLPELADGELFIRAWSGSPCGETSATAQHTIVRKALMRSSIYDVKSHRLRFPPRHPNYLLSADEN